MALIGLNAKLYRNTGTYGSPTWDEVTNVRDLSTNLETGEAEGSTRGGGGWRQVLTTLKDGTVEFEMVWEPGDTDFEAFRDAWLNGTLIDCWVLDGSSSTSGNQGLRAEFAVLNFSRPEPLEEVLTASVTMRPGISSNPPAWDEVA